MVEYKFIDIDRTETENGSAGTPTEPVTLSEAKKHMNVDEGFTDDDDYITALISQCRASVEDYCHISIVEKIITATIENSNFPTVSFPSSNNNRAAYIQFELPYGPIKSFTSLSDNSDSSAPKALVLNTDYYLLGTLYKTIKINNNYCANTLIYLAGYDLTKFPADLKLAILNEISFRYESRGDEAAVRATAFTEVGVCQSARVLADKYRRLAWQ